MVFECAGSIPDIDTLNASRLIFDLQRADRIARRVHACLDAEIVAKRITDGFVEEFGFALARIWLVEPERTHLKLVASSGLHTRTDGSFGRVPTGAFKVGKIAQNRVSFLSNNLPNEPWVKDRDWALRHGIQGFAGYPLATPETVVGVLALFSREPLEPEFLEALLSLCATTTVALGNAIEFQRAGQAWQVAAREQPFSKSSPPLSDLLARILGPVPLKLFGTERSLDLSRTHLFLALTEEIQRLNCLTCGLTYGDRHVTFNATVLASGEIVSEDELSARLEPFSFASACSGGSLEVSIDAPRKVSRISLKLPYGRSDSDISVLVDCRSPVLQLAFTRMVQSAGFRPAALSSTTTPLITDRDSLVRESQYPLWVDRPSRGDAGIPEGIKAKLSLDTTPDDLRDAVRAVLDGGRWGIGDTIEKPVLSEREREVMKLLVRGARDREIAARLFISESTVKFHINNVLAKLKVKTRIQAVYELTRDGELY